MIELSKTAYSEKSIRDTIYWMSKLYSISLDINKDYYVVKCSELSNDFEKDFLTKVNDFELRNLVEIQTREIRSLITAKAFYPDLVNFKDVGEFDDPVIIEKRNVELND